MFSKKGKGIIAILLILSLMVAFSGCTKESKLDQIKKKGKIVLGTAADYPPYEFHKEINGQDTIVGFDIEIAKAIAEDLGVELEIKDMKFDGLLAALVADKIDFIVAGMVPTEDREKSVDFTNQYYKADQSILIKAEDADKFKTKEDFKGAVVGAQKTTIQEDIAKSIEGAEVKGLSKITDLVLELSNDKVDAVVLVNPVAKAYAKSNPQLYVPEISFGTEDGVAAAVNEGNKELVDAINKTLDKLISEGKIEQFISDACGLAYTE
ncbi:MAG: transporter substrate-binding domain-containing protein [Maledivibacter sp.]|jgi:polar amino acid transport system substrate-binding protein|nr:transporter substrate-binding domain-containing protein [Maledivibacter sp.]